MIYVCEAFGSCCRYADAACGKCCETCSECWAPCCQVLERPLGMYILLTSVICLPAAACAMGGLADKKVRECDDPLLVLCVVDIALALLHVAFGCYLQSRLVEGLSRPDTGQAAPLPGAAEHGVTQQPTPKELMNRAGHIICYDIGFCIYMFFFIGSFLVNCIGPGFAATCKPDSPLPALCFSLLILFAVVAVSFAMLWYCVLACEDCCGSLLRPRRRPQQQPQKKPPLFLRMLLGSKAGGSGTAAQSPPAGYGSPLPANGHPPTVMGVPAGPLQYGTAPYGAPPVAGYPHGGVAPVAGYAGYAVPPASPGGAAYGGAPVMGQPVHAPPPAPPPAHVGRASGGAKAAAAKTAGAGLSALGAGLQTAGKWLGGSQSKSTE